MEFLTKEQFAEWAKEQNWLFIAEISAPTGRQYQYITPTGKIVVAITDLKGNLIGIGEPISAAQMMGGGQFGLSGSPRTGSPRRG